MRRRREGGRTIGTRNPKPHATEAPRANGTSRLRSSDSRDDQHTRQGQPHEPCKPTHRHVSFSSRFRDPVVNRRLGRNGYNATPMRKSKEMHRSKCRSQRKKTRSPNGWRTGLVVYQLSGSCSQSTLQNAKQARHHGGHGARRSNPKGFFLRVLRGGELIRQRHSRNRTSATPSSIAAR